MTVPPHFAEYPFSPKPGVRLHELSAGGGIRQDRYRPLWTAADCPVRTDLIPYEDMFVEPLYQLLRQQLLAHEIGKGARGWRPLRQSPARFARRELGAADVAQPGLTPGGWRRLRHLPPPGCRRA